MKKVILFCLILGFGAQACMDEDENPNQEIEDLQETQDVQISRHLEENNIDAEKDVATGAYVLPLVENASGLAIAQGDVAEVTYTLTQLDGTPIGDNVGDSMRLAYDPNTYYSPAYLYYALGHMRNGEKYRFYIPFDDAYGNFELQGVIPYRSIVVMELEVKDVYQTGDALKAGDINMIERVLADRGQDADTLAGGVRKFVLEEGEGVQPDAKDVASVYYTGTYLNGEEFDSNTGANDSKFELTIGGGGVIPGFETAVKSMKVGEKALFYIPSSLAYGKGVIYAAPEEIREKLSQDAGLRQRYSAGQILMPPHSPLVFELELVDVVVKE